MPNLTNDIEATLIEYTQLQKQEQELTQRKHELQDKLKSCFRGETQHIWNPEVDGTRLKGSYRSVPPVEYNEEVRRKRLGNRYSALLEPDIRKLRAELPNLEEELKPLLDRIGRPSGFPPAHALPQRLPPIRETNDRGARAAGCR